MLIVPNVDFPGNQRINTAKWILRRKYGSKAKQHTEKWIVMEGSSKDYHSNNNI
jgi:hypothetical protein